MAYGLSLYVVRRSAAWKAKSALVKGSIMAAFGAAVLGQAAYRLAFPHPPAAEDMGIMGLAAWPDIMTGAALAVFVLRSAFRVLGRARAELRAAVPVS